MPKTTTNYETRRSTIVIARNFAKKNVWYQKKKTARVFLALQITTSPHKQCQTGSPSAKSNATESSSPSVCLCGPFPPSTGNQQNICSGALSSSMKLMSSNWTCAFLGCVGINEFLGCVYTWQGVAGYQRFLNETNKLPKCKSIRIFLRYNHHALVPSMLHLLKRCNSTKKISVILPGSRKLPLVIRP